MYREREGERKKGYTRNDTFTDVFFANRQM